MRKLKLVPFMLIPAIFGLSSCTLPSWLSWLPFGDKEEKEEKPKEKEESKAHTAEQICTDINSAFNNGLEFEADTFGTYSGYYAGNYRLTDTADASTYPDNASEETLLDAAEYVAGAIPEYCEADSYWYYDGVITEGMSEDEKEEHDYWGDEDGSTALEAYFYNEDESVAISILTYCYNGYPIFGIGVIKLA
jgi:hypothetical protein